MEKKKKDKLLLLFFLSPFRRFPFLPRRAGPAFSSYAHLSTHVEQEIWAIGTDRIYAEANQASHVVFFIGVPGTDE
jgi:hypothetical protein